MGSFCGCDSSQLFMSPITALMIAVIVGMIIVMQETATALDKKDAFVTVSSSEIKQELSLTHCSRFVNISASRPHHLYPNAPHSPHHPYFIIARRYLYALSMMEE
jgi:hypothetical protein